MVLPSASSSPPPEAVKVDSIHTAIAMATDAIIARKTLSKLPPPSSYHLAPLQVSQYPTHPYISQPPSLQIRIGIRNEQTTQPDLTAYAILAAPHVKGPRPSRLHVPNCTQTVRARPRWAGCGPHPARRAAGCCEEKGRKVLGVWVVLWGESVGVDWLADMYVRV